MNEGKWRNGWGNWEQMGFDVGEGVQGKGRGRGQNWKCKKESTGNFEPPHLTTPSPCPPRAYDPFTPSPFTSYYLLPHESNLKRGVLLIETLTKH